MSSRRITPFVLFVTALLVLAPVVLPHAAWGAARLTIINLDAGTGKGLDDRTPVKAIGGNPGTTLGAQRLNALQRAADTWGAGLSDQVEILIDATFAPLACDERSAFLGAAGPTEVEANFPRAPRADTWYPIALANKLAGVDLDPPAPAGLVGDDIVAFFNSSIDGGGACLKGANWYYGFDGKPSANELDFLTVGLHELAHGLGALSFVNVATGENLGPNHLNDVWNTMLKDGVTGRRWSEMSADERKVSAVSGNVIWAGDQVKAQAVSLENGKSPDGTVRMFAPNPAIPGSSISHFDLSLKPGALGQPVLTGAVHDLGITRSLLEDLGWTTDLCGNGIIDHNELCDKASLKGKTCSDIAGYNIGTLGCNSSCDAFDVRRCFFIPPTAPLDDLKLVDLPAQHYMMRSVGGGYEKHPDAILELDQMAATNAAIHSARTGPVTGFYYTDPALVSGTDLQWAIGLPMNEKADTSFLKSLSNYEMKAMPAHKVLIVNSSVSKAWFDGMRILLWLKNNGYKYTPPVRMEYYPVPGQPEATSIDPATNPNSDGPTRIIVMVEKATDPSTVGTVQQ